MQGKILRGVVRAKVYAYMHLQVLYMFTFYMLSYICKTRVLYMLRRTIQIVFL
jgi:hypothetical protein